MPALNTSFLFSKLDGDSLACLLSVCSYPTLCRLRSTCKTADRLVADEMEYRYSTSLRDFVDDARGFRDMLNETGSVIAGSFAVKVGSGRKFRPGDLDVYTGRKTAGDVVAHLEKTAGFAVCGEDTPIDPLLDEYVGDIDRIIHLSRGGVSIDVVVSLSVSATLPIAYFWSTVPMIYFGGDGLCIAYPRLFEADRGLLNPARTEAHWGMIGLDAVRDKYEARGFQFRATEEEWTPPGDRVPPCKKDRSGTCPLTTRFFGDPFCLQTSFKTLSDRKTARAFTGTLASVTNVWWRGGSGCGGPCNMFGVAKFRALTQTADVVGL